MSYRPSRRHWLKLWTREWLDGSMSVDLLPAEQAVWIDLLALAGQSRFPGIIAAGEENSEFRGYPIRHIAEMCHKPLKLVNSAVAKFEEHGAVTINRQDSTRDQASVIFINNWVKYQSEYQRKKAGKEGQGELFTVTEGLVELQPEGYLEEQFCHHLGKLYPAARGTLKQLEREHGADLVGDAIEVVGTDPSKEKSLSEVAKVLRSYRAKKKP